MDKCRICGWEGIAEKIVVREMMYNTRDTFGYFVCPTCNCLQIEEVPENLGKYYATDYYSYEQPDTSVSSSPKIDEVRILDVGCGAGLFLSKLAKQGYTNLYGCDPFIEHDLMYENNVKIYKKTIHEMEGIYDRIYLNDSFEHVTDPHEVMESICRLLAPDGVARIALPVYPNIAFDMFGVHWYQLDAPRHIFLHSKRSMEYLVKKHGLKIERKEYDSNNSQIVRSFLYEKNISFYNQTPNVIRQYFTQEVLDEIGKNAVIVNQNERGDHAVFYIRHAER